MIDWIIVKLIILGAISIGVVIFIMLYSFGAYAHVVGTLNELWRERIVKRFSKLIGSKNA